MMQPLQRRRHIAVAIAISKLSGKQPLPGVMSDAGTFVGWAAAQGFACKRFDDSTSDVELRPISQYFRNLVEAENVTRLFVFLAGHGACSSPAYGDPSLFLSRFPQDHSEAIDIGWSIELARESRIPHIAFFVDTCRTSEIKPPWSSVRGNTIFPDLRAGQPHEDENWEHSTVSEVDIFYATRWGKEALETPTPPQGIFSKCLLDALEGTVQQSHPEVPVREVKGGKEHWAVPAKPLSQFLYHEVPRRARAVNARQLPDCRPVTEWRPHVISWITSSAAAASAPNSSADPPMNSSPIQDLRYISEVDANFKWQETLTASPYVAMHIEGAEILGVDPPHDYENSHEGGSIVRREDDESGPLVARIRCGDEEQWCLSAVLPNHTTSIRVSPNIGVDASTFLPVSHPVSPSIQTARADALARMSLGMLQPDPELFDLAVKELDPVLAIASSYALAAIGDHGTAQKLVGAFIDHGSAIPFDVVIAAGVDPRDVPRHVPEFPLGSRGWLRLTRLLATREIATAISNHLIAGPWSTARIELPENVISALVAAHIK